MDQVLAKAREQLYDCKLVTGKLRAMLQSADEQVRSLKKQSTFLSQLAAKTIPNGIHCLSLRLTIDYYLLEPEKRSFPRMENLENPNLYHYALFSDNVLAASVVVNSTIKNAKEPEKHVFHLVTDKLNFGAMNMWFLLNPPGKATIHVENVDEFKWLNSSYCPVLRQLESAAMKEYYFQAAHPTIVSAGSSNLKYRNPKYLSMLNNLRFYLPQVYLKLDKILFLDDDIVVKKDLTGLWAVDLHGKVNGAVETCGENFHLFDKYLNFSNPHIARNFDPNACGWAYGMNMFDLKEWKKRDITGIYHRWQNLSVDSNWLVGTCTLWRVNFARLTRTLREGGRALCPCDELWLGKAHIPRISKVRGLSKLEVYSLSTMDGKRTRIRRDDLCDHDWEFHFTKTAPVYWRNLDPYWNGTGQIMHRYFHQDGSQTADPGDEVWGGHEACYCVVTGMETGGKIREHYVRINRSAPMSISRNLDWSWEMNNNFCSYSSIPNPDKIEGTGPL
ncbi:OLC1v1019437C1 [Oldenlandia corymbosa var. corymbosa]|uniref:Hexosyltransferase n=1 Tax=Oldenlandia corymbosa var. corymbosa TaxID=529605 RepID=A0AAV1EDZ0_OLDCO|nr:OLC1v1019437C1 [Oldenlandia corymbosa var. corymbosa]